MSKILAPLLLLLLTCGPSFSQEIQTIAFDSLDQVKTRIVLDETTKIAGKSSLKLSSPHSAQICVGEIESQHIENATIWFQADLKTQGVANGALLEMWVETEPQGRYFSRGLDQVVSGDSDWKTVRIPFAVNQPGVSVRKIILNLVLDGPGTVWIGNIKVEKQPLRAGQ